MRRLILTSALSSIGYNCFPTLEIKRSIEKKMQFEKIRQCASEFKQKVDSMRISTNVYLNEFMKNSSNHRQLTILAEEEDEYFENPRVIFVLGPPGAGKRTQCKYLIEEFQDYDHISVKDLIRFELKSKDTQWGHLIEHHIVNGTVVPVYVIMSLLLRAFRASKKKNFVIDGFPQNKEQWETWMNVLGAEKCDIKFVLYIKCDESTSVLRCIKQVGQGPKVIEDIEMIEESLHSEYLSYMKDCTPMVDHFKKYGLIRQIDGSKPKQVVLEEIKSKCIF